MPAQLPHHTGGSELSSLVHRAIMLDPAFWSGFESQFLIGVLITGVPISVDSFGCVKLIMVARLEHLSEPPALQPLPRPTNPHDHYHGPALTALAPHCPTQ